MSIDTDAAYGVQPSVLTGKTMIKMFSVPSTFPSLYC